CQQYNGLPITF
nr:immunoglobulin light chain junction region [Macaca mulatta]